MLSSSIPGPGYINSALQIPQTRLQATSPFWEILLQTQQLWSCPTAVPQKVWLTNQKDHQICLASVGKWSAKDVADLVFRYRLKRLWLPTVTVLPSKATKETLESPVIHSSTLRPAFEEDSQRQWASQNLSVPWVHPTSLMMGPLPWRNQLTGICRTGIQTNYTHVMSQSPSLIPQPRTSCPGCGTGACQRWRTPGKNDRDPSGWNGKRWPESSGCSTKVTICIYIICMFWVLPQHCNSG